jgi:arylsulfatase A-like enzyme
MPTYIRQRWTLLVVVTLLIIAAAFWWTLQPDAEQKNTKLDSAIPTPQNIAANSAIPVIIYVVDTLRADRLGLYGYEKATSWRIDAIAAESVVFDRAYAPAPWTLPSVVSLFTSTFVCEHAMVETMRTGGELATAVGPGPELKTLAERLDAVDYRNGGFVANTVVGPSSGLYRGYDEYVLSTGADSETVRLEQAQTFLDQVGPDPFLLYLHTMEPHDIHQTPERYVKRIGDPNVQLMLEYAGATARYAYLRHRDWTLGNPLGTTENTAAQDELFAYFAGARESIEILYDAAVLWADANVGDVVDMLKERGLWDKAMFIFLSDHGEELGEHGGWFHGQSMYEELAHVPLIIHFPDGEFGGQRISTPVSLVDVMPTIFDYQGRSELCDGCRGTSLLPLLGEAERPLSNNILIPGLRMNRVNYRRPWKESRGDVNVMLLNANWKGIWNDDLESLELYDLVQDPGERSDMHAHYPELTQAMRDRAGTWLQDCRAREQQREELGEIDEETREQLRSLGYFD